MKYNISLWNALQYKVAWTVYSKYKYLTFILNHSTSLNVGYFLFLEVLVHKAKTLSTYSIRTGL